VLWASVRIHEPTPPRRLDDRRHVPWRDGGQGVRQHAVRYIHAGEDAASWASQGIGDAVAKSMN
jgi:hypothetical protein